MAHTYQSIVSSRCTIAPCLLLPHTPTRPHAPLSLLIPPGHSTLDTPTKWVCIWPLQILEVLTYAYYNLTVSKLFCDLTGASCKLFVTQIVHLKCL